MLRLAGYRPADRRRLLPAAPARRHVGRLFDPDHDRDLRRHVLRRRRRAVLSRRSQPRSHPVLGDRRLHRRQSVGEIRPQWLVHGACDHPALHRGGSLPRRRHAAHTRVRVFAGDLCGGRRGLRDRLQLGCDRRLRRHRRHFRAETAVRLCQLCRRVAGRAVAGRLRAAAADAGLHRALSPLEARHAPH